MQIIKFPKEENWPVLMNRPLKNVDDIKKIVEKIFDNVRANGDKAINFYNKKFDGFSEDSFVIDVSDQLKKESKIDQRLITAIKVAKKNIEKFHNSQREINKKVETMNGISCWRESRALESVGLYIPGGSAPLFSSLLMLGIPAKIAKCKNVIVCSPSENGKINPIILYTAKLLGIKKIFAVGGAQAIAAMTFGTVTIPKVDKIFGPGNQYVTQGKLFAQSIGIAIDVPAGPSEVLIIADKSSNPQFIAADLLAQAEHGPDSQVLLLTDDKTILKEVALEIKNQIAQLERKNEIMSSLNESKLILLKDISQCFRFSNSYAPEHLAIQVKDARKYIKNIESAGSVFIGNYTCESLGDYATGTNHTLPTNGYAKAYSGVSLDSFFKKITFQKVKKEGILKLGKHVEKMALAEGLTAHKNAVSIRLNTLF